MKPSVFLRFIAFILIVTVSVTLVPTGVIFAEDVSYEYPFFSEEQYPVSDYSFDDTEMVSDSSVDALYEEENLRTYNSKTLRLSDGTHTAGTYGFSVHFETSEGFAEYDNTLKLCEGRYMPTASDSGLSFDEYKPSYSMRIGGKDVTFTLINDGQNYISAQTDTLPEEKYETKTDELFSVPKAKSQIEYVNILDGVTLSYLIYGRNVKESIILEFIPDTYSYQFMIATDSDVYIDEEGNIHIDEAVIPHAYMYDSSGASTDAVEFILDTADGGYILSVVPEREWLEDGDRVYPVTIDPTVITDAPSYGQISDAYVKSGVPDYNTNYFSFLHIGNAENDPNLLKLRSYFRINNLPELPKASRILSAVVALQQTRNGAWYSFASTDVSRLNVAACEVTSAWSVSQISWNNQPSFSDIVIDYSTVSSDSALSYLHFDITSCMQKWYEDSSTNNGIVFLSSIEDSDGFVTFISSDDVIYSTTTPSFFITYYDTKGLESRWSYISKDVGTAGTLYVNLYNGKPVLTGPSVTTPDEILTMSVYPVYNGYLSGLQFAPDATNKNAPNTVNFNSGAGYGFKLSCWESIKSMNIGQVPYFCYTDSDGTELYFRYFQNSGYLSEDGYDLTFMPLLTSQSMYYKITDSNGTVKYFDSSGRVSLIIDESGNRRTYVYDSIGRLISVSFKSSTMSSAETQLTFTYNSGNAIKRITNAKSTDIYMDFYYSSTYSGSVSQTNTGFLRKIVCSDGNFAEYHYTSDGNLYIIKQGNGTTYGAYARLYYNNSGFVSKLCEYSSDGYLGNQTTFEYNQRKTVVITPGKDDVHGNTDDLLSVFLFDNYGNTVCSYLTDASGNIYGASSAEYTKGNYDTNPKANNSVTKTGSGGQYYRNYINNGNLESISGWTAITDHVTAGSTSSVYLFGRSSVYLYGSAASSGGILRQNVTVPESGTYTFSVYVKSELSMGTQSDVNGAYITLDGKKSDVISGVTNTNIRNGWRQLYVTKTFNTAGTYTLELNLSNMLGYVYFDGASLIKSDSPAAEFNYLNNAWIYIASPITYESDGSVKIKANSAGNSSGCYVPVYMNKPASSAAFVLSGWSSGYSVPEEDTTAYPAAMSSYVHKNRFWGLEAVIYYTDGTSESQKIPFNSNITEYWQYVSGVVMPSENNLNKTVNCVYVYLRYDYNANHALFKDISLTEADAVSYEYDANGKITKIRTTENTTSLAYSGTDITNISTDTDNISYTYVSGTHKVNTATDSQGVTATYTYDSNGLPTSSVITPSSGSGSISSSVSYNSYGNAIYLTDTAGGLTISGYDTNKGLLSYITNANNHKTQYVYDIGGRLTEIYADNDKDGVHDSNESGVSYTYNEKNYLTEIYNGQTTYRLTYDNYGNVTAIYIGSSSVPLVSYAYASRNGKLMSVTYGDGTVVSNAYDNLNRIKSVSYNGTVAYTVKYDGNGNVSSYTDCATGRVYRYEYDAMGREVRYFVSLNGTELYSAEKFYDNAGRMSGYTYTIGGVGSRTSSDTYDSYNRLSQEQTAGGDNITYTYDGFGRVTSKTTGSFSESYEYVSNGSRTTTLVSKVTQKYGGLTIKTVQYTYDSLGNILTEDDGVTYRQYTYDSLNQLASDLYYDKTSGIGKAKYYFNGTSGNVSYIEFDYNNGSYSSSGSSGNAYGSGTDWKELMTSYRGVPITYDANGNPLSYYNGRSYTFTWQKGRQLGSAVTATNSVTYSYDITGLRISKNVNGTVHNYTYDGSMLLVDRWGSQYIEYFYDASGSPYALNYYNGSSSTKYYFIKNLEGDILELRTSYGATIARYIYDAWGKVLDVRDASGNTITSQTHIANINCLRYRGYVYDNETGLYYLESRYYDPQTERFINADGYISTGIGILGYNMYAYCMNNPVNMQDPSGEIAITTLILIGSIVAGCLAAGHTAATSYKYTGKVDVGNTILAGLGTFFTAYTWGMSAYSVYLTYCDYKGCTPVTEIGSSVNNSSASVNNSSAPVSQFHGNSSQSAKPQHGYEIYNKQTGDVVKTGISGQPLNQNGTSPRANIQVNAFNKLEGDEVYAARIVEQNIPGRAAALEWERKNTQILWDMGNSLSKHIRPNPMGR